MNSIHVLERDFSLVGILDSYQSVIWRPSYSEIGDFEITLGATTEATELLRENRFVVRDSDIEVNDGVVTYKKVMIIKGISLTTNAEDGDFLIVTGKELKFLLNSRIVWSMTTLTGTVENAIRTLVNQNAINPTDSNRKIPNLVLADAVGIKDTIEKQITGENLGKAVSDICLTYKLGWDVYISGGNFVFSLYSGKNRSYSQTENPYVVFADEFDNLFDTSYQFDSVNYANCTLVGGEGEGAARKYTTVGGDVSGLDRFEMFTDAKDISSTNDGATISTSQYLKLLEERGKEKLAEKSFTEGFSGEVLSDVVFVYGTDFFLGDIVTVRTKYGIQRDVMVLSAIESENESGTTLIPQFNI